MSKEAAPKIVVSIDPGRDAGLAVFNADGELLVYQDVDVRNDESIHAAQMIFDTFAGRLCVIAAERGGWSGQRNAFHLGVHLGMLIGSLGLNGSEISYVAPSEWRLAALGCGGADKDDALEAVRAKYPSFTGTHNAAEAIAIGEWFFKTQKAA